MAVERKFIKESVNRLLVKDFVQAETAGMRERSTR